MKFISVVCLFAISITTTTAQRPVVGAALPQNSTTPNVAVSTIPPIYNTTSNNGTVMLTTFPASSPRTSSTAASVPVSQKPMTTSSGEDSNEFKHDSGSSESAEKKHHGRRHRLDGKRILEDVLPAVLLKKILKGHPVSLGLEQKSRLFFKQSGGTSGRNHFGRWKEKHSGSSESGSEEKSRGQEGSAASTSLLAKQFTEHSVVPDIIPTLPKQLLEVMYKTGVNAELGNVLKPRLVKDQPELKWIAEKTELYTLAFLDADAPSRYAPAERSILHWLVVNIPESDVKAGQVIVEFIGSGPENGLHRYIFLAYKQPGQINPAMKHITDHSAEGRDHFNVTMFANQNNLGAPVAGNFYQAEFDDYVPELLKQLGV